MTLKEFTNRGLFKNGTYFKVWLMENKFIINKQVSGCNKDQRCRVCHGTSWRFMYVDELNKEGDEIKLLGEPTKDLFSLSLKGKRGYKNSEKIIKMVCGKIFSYDMQIFASSITEEEAKRLPLDLRRQGDYWVPSKHKINYNRSHCSFGVKYSGEEIYLENDELFYSYNNRSELAIHPVRPVILPYGNRVKITVNNQCKGTYDKPYLISII